MNASKTKRQSYILECVDGGAGIFSSKFSTAASSSLFTITNLAFLLCLLYTKVGNRDRKLEDSGDSCLNLLKKRLQFFCINSKGTFGSSKKIGDGGGAHNFICLA